MERIYWRRQLDKDHQQASRSGRRALTCKNPELAGVYARQAARFAAYVIETANLLYGESGWTVDELKQFFKL